MGLNSGLHSEKPVTNYLKYVTTTVKVAADSGQCSEKHKLHSHIQTREAVYNSSRIVIYFSYDVELRKRNGRVLHQVKLFVCHTMKSGGIAPCTLNLSTRCKSMVSLTPRVRTSQYILHRRLGGLQSRSGYCGDKKNLCSCLKSKPDSPVF
jgi:hypothetical protein